MTDLLSNQWTIGIVIGLISGLILIPINNIFNLNSKRKEYTKTVNTAEAEVKNIIIDFISEETYFDMEILKSLRISTARKYQINVLDMMSINEMLEDTVKIIFDTDFISTKNKVKKSQELLNLKEKEKPKIIDSAEVEKLKSLISKQRSIIQLIILVPFISYGAITIINESLNINYISIEKIIAINVNIIFFISLVLIMRGTWNLYKRITISKSDNSKKANNT